MKCINSPNACSGIRNIYIYPSKAGWLFLMASAVMWIFGINYDNNLVLLVAMFGVSCMISSVFYSYANIRGLSFFPIVNDREIWAGEGVPISLRISKDNSMRIVHGIRISAAILEDGIPQDYQINSIATILCRDNGRGVFTFPRFKIYSDFPLGLIRSSFYVESKASVLVYPRPISCEFLPQKDLREIYNTKDTETETKYSVRSGMDEISGLKKYRAGDPVNLVDWKQLARGRGLMVREFSSDKSTSVCLTKESIKSTNYEEQISMLAYAAKELSQRGVRFGISFYGCDISPMIGEEHCKSLLKELALLPKEQQL